MTIKDKSLIDSLPARNKQGAGRREKGAGRREIPLDQNLFLKKKLKEW